MLLFVTWIKEFLVFGENVVDKRKCHHFKYPIDTNNVEINRVLISNKVSSSKKDYKYFLDKKDDNEVNLVRIALPKIIE